MVVVVAHDSFSFLPTVLVDVAAATKCLLGLLLVSLSYTFDTYLGVPVVCMGVLRPQPSAFTRYYFLL